MYVSSKRTTLGKEFGTSEVQLGTCWAKPCEIMKHVENPSLGTQEQQKNKRSPFSSKEKGYGPLAYMLACLIGCQEFLCFEFLTFFQLLFFTSLMMFFSIFDIG